MVSPSTGSRRSVVSYWRKNVHKVLVNLLVGLSLPRKSVPRLTDHRDMTLAVYRGCKKFAVDKASDSKARGPRLDTRSGHRLLFLFLLIQEGQLSVAGKSMCMKYLLTA